MARPRDSSAVKCSICDTSFARQEHLTRHIRIHTREKPFQCDRCGKAFARMDVLNRHTAAHEEAAPEAPASARACKECAASRVRCSRTQPCKRCTEKSLSCVFPTDRKRRASALSDANENGTASAPELQTGFAVPDDSRPAFNTVVAGEIDQAAGFQVGSPAQFPPQGGFGMPSDSAWINSVGNIDLQPSPASFYNPAQAGMGISIVNWMSPQNPQAVDWDTQLADFNVTNEGVVGHGGFPFFFAGADITVPSAEWSAPTPQGHGASLGISAITPSRTNHEGELRSSHSVMESATSTSTDGRYYVDGSGARAPFGGRSNTRRSVVGIDAMHEKNTVEDPRSNMLSPAELVPDAAYENICQHIQDQPHLTSANMETIPSLSHVQLFVQYYFDKFHPIFPFLRRRSFPEDCSQSWLLLLAVAVVGSRYLNRLHGGQPVEILQQVLQNNLDQWFYNSGPEDCEPAPFVPGESLAGPDIRVLQAGILNTICMLHSGNKANVERSFLNRHRLIEACHGLGLLAGTLSSSLTEPGDMQLLSKWLREESETRTGMMIWLLDSMFVYAFGGKPLLHLDDIKARLPCREELWEASSPRSNISNKVAPIPLHEALEMIYMEKRLPQGLGEFSTVILINAIYRKTKDVVALAQTQLNSWTPTATVQRRMKSPLIEESWPPTTPTLSKWRNSACDGLDMLHWSANSKAAGLSGLEHHTILQLHLSRLIILTPTAHIQTFATDSSATQPGSRPESHRYIGARNKVLQWAVRDQFKARLSVIHCGALIWHVRRYSRDSVVEPFAIYIATLVLWAFCVSVQFVGQGAFENDASAETPAAGSGSTPHAPDLTEDDIPEPSFIHLDRPLDDELVQLFVQMGHKMSGYISRVGNIHDSGAPRKILLEGIRLLTRDTPTGSHSEDRVQQSGEKPCYTWGIEGSYIGSLGRLVRATAGVSNEPT